MRRRTLQYLGLLFVAVVAIHLYFFSPSSESDSPHLSDWDNIDEILAPEPQRGLSADPHRRDAIVASFQYAWSAYERDAMGSDEYHPISHRGTNLSHSGGIGYTVVDAIDTMLLMGLHQEYSRASDWVRNSLSFDRDGRNKVFNTFETTIRVLGGLLSAHHLSSDDMYLRHAVDLADRMLPAFDTPSGIPFTSIDLAARAGIPDAANHISTAEATTLQLEFRDLAQLTKNSDYWYKAEKVMSVVNDALLPNHLAPISMDANGGSFLQSDIRLGSRGDSYYEYLLKQYLQTASSILNHQLILIPHMCSQDQTERVYLKMYEDAMQGIHDNLVQKTATKKLTYIAELQPRGGEWRTNWLLHHKQDHLVCFLAGSLMLGATTTGARVRGTVSVPPRMEELTKAGQRDWKTGVELLEGCMATHQTATGLSPEIVQFQPSPDQPERDWYIKGSKPGGPASYDARYMLRPETVESLFLAWRLTGDKRYRDYAWGIFESIEKHCRLPDGGYATVLDVDTVPVRHDDKQETFFLVGSAFSLLHVMHIPTSETLKYLFLVFADEAVLPLDGYVLNTEAHPLPIFRPSIQPLFTL
ncbi:alpha-1,2-Mannosidase [Mycena sanguinolenta]|uniref:alpha-1,2-Mannosidase n=1 Tax=Mycena sanguinolenta TaxID=230812 RepID=A0A8H7DCF5_9AGAR|nr:alpha-1,2-Mannosidase [Mycena sanguinolenta]